MNKIDENSVKLTYKKFCLETPFPDCFDSWRATAFESVAAESKKESSKGQTSKSSLAESKYERLWRPLLGPKSVGAKKQHGEPSQDASTESVQAVWTGRVQGESEL